MSNKPLVERIDINPIRNGNSEKPRIAPRVIFAGMYAAEVALTLLDSVKDVKNEIQERISLPRLPEPGTMRAAIGMDLGTYYTPSDDQNPYM